MIPRKIFKKSSCVGCRYVFGKHLLSSEKMCKQCEEKVSSGSLIKTNCVKCGQEGYYFSMKTICQKCRSLTMKKEREIERRLNRYGH